MRNIYTKEANPDVDYVLVSIDPEKLKAYSTEEHLDGDQLILLQGSLDDVREFPNMLSYKIQKDLSCRFFAYEYYFCFRQKWLVTLSARRSLRQQ